MENLPNILSSDLTRATMISALRHTHGDEAIQEARDILDDPGDVEALVDEVLADLLHVSDLSDELSRAAVRLLDEVRSTAIEKIVQDRNPFAQLEVLLRS